VKYLLMVLGKQSGHEAMSGRPTDGFVRTEKNIAAMVGFMEAVNKEAVNIAHPTVGAVNWAAAPRTSPVLDGAGGQLDVREELGRPKWRRRGAGTSSPRSARRRRRSRRRPG
jgi:hypothetical protein